MSQITEPLTSPLQEVAKESLAELFARDPLALTDDNVEKICIELRAQRAKWVYEDRTKAPKGAGAKPKVAISSGEMDDLLNSL